MFNEIVCACKFLLNEFPGAQDCRDYLDLRINKKSQDLFDLGYFPTINNLQALTSIVGEDVLKDNKLLSYWKLEDSLSTRSVPKSYFKDQPLLMPFKDPYGEIVGLVARSILSDMARGDSAKYKNTKDSYFFKKGNLLFGLYENKKSIIENDLVYVVEGQFDVIKSVECGLTNIVALGTSSMTPYQFSTISRYTNNIILLLDNDDSGEKGRESIISKFGKFA